MLATYSHSTLYLGRSTIKLAGKDCFSRLVVVALVHAYTSVCGVSHHFGSVVNSVCVCVCVSPAQPSPAQPRWCAKLIRSALSLCEHLSERVRTDLYLSNNKLRRSSSEAQYEANTCSFKAFSTRSIRFHLINLRSTDCHKGREVKGESVQ